MSGLSNSESGLCQRSCASRRRANISISVQILNDDTFISRRTTLSVFLGDIKRDNIDFISVSVNFNNPSVNSDIDDFCISSITNLDTDLEFLENSSV